MGATQANARVIRNSRIIGNYYTLVIEQATMARSALPGQFVMVKVNDASAQPLLRRPFGIHSVQQNRIAILYEVLGPGTRILSQRKTGDCVDLIGPLGNGFAYRRPQGAGRKPLLVAGGMGVAPLLFLAQRLACRGPRYPIGDTKVLIGAKTKSQMLCENEFRRLGCAVDVATDDGSKGFKGRVTDLLKLSLRPTNQGPRATLYACGPRPMLREIARIALALKMPAYLSLEEHMACGIGACLGCAVRTHQGYKRVCSEGPVFGAEEIVWD